MPVAAYVSIPDILINGQHYDGLSYNVMAIAVTESITGLYHCAVTFYNHGERENGEQAYLFFDREVLDFGSEISIELGDPLQSIFKGQITALEADFSVDGVPTMTVLAEDKMQSLRMRRRTRTFEDMTDGDIISDIARDHGLTPSVDIQGETHRVITQVNLSDLAFIRERARANGAELWMEGNTLHVMNRSSRDNSALITLEYGRDLLNFSVTADLAHQVSKVVVSGWDVSAKEAINESADENSISSELNGGESGGSILASAFTERTETVVHNVPLTIGEAREYARALYRERARKFICASGVVSGNNALRVGRKVTVENVGLFSGDYVVTQTIHTYDGENGYRTEFDVERAGL